MIYLITSLLVAVSVVHTVIIIRLLKTISNMSQDSKGYIYMDKLDE